MKRPSRSHLLIAGACAAALLLIGWWSLGPRNDPAGAVKGLAVKAAAGDPAAIAALRGLGSNAVPALVELTQYREPFLRRQAWALAPRMSSRLRRTLLTWAGPMDAYSLRAAGAKALALLGPQAEAAVPALLHSLHDSEQYVAMQAAAALGRIGKASVPGLSAALADKNAVVRHAAAYALGEIGPDAEAAMPDLIETMQDRDPQVRASTAYSLLLIGYPAVAGLSNVIDHADASARDLAVDEFIRFYRSLRSLTPPLNKMARADEAGSRRHALQALAAIRAVDDETINTFVGALHDPVVEVRLAAVQALRFVSWRAQPAVGGLTSCLQDTSPEVRQWAARTLGLIGPPARPALADLNRCLQDQDGSVRAAAQQAIGQIAPANNQ